MDVDSEVVGVRYQHAPSNHLVGNNTLVGVQLENIVVHGLPGKRVGSAEVAEVRKGKRGTTVIGILVNKDLAMDVRSIRISERSDG